MDKDSLSDDVMNWLRQDAPGQNGGANEDYWLMIHAKNAVRIGKMGRVALGLLERTKTTLAPSERDDLLDEAGDVVGKLLVYLFQSCVPVSVQPTIALLQAHIDALNKQQPMRAEGEDGQAS